MLDSWKVRVDKIFTTLLIKQENALASQNHSDYIQYEVLLTEAEKRRNESCKDCIILLVEGPAGVGKTTLIKKIISDWAPGTSAMKTHRL